MRLKLFQIAAVSLWLFSIPILTYAKDKTASYEIQVNVRGVYEYTEIKTAGNSAFYTGFGYGENIGVKLYSKNIGVGVFGGFSRLIQQNTANSSLYSEQLKSTNGFLIGRFYSGKLFLGLGLRISSYEVVAHNSGVQTKYKYSGYGGRSQFGFEIPLGKSFQFTPTFSYDFLSIRPYDSSQRSSVNSYCPELSIGFNF